MVPMSSFDAVVNAEHLKTQNDAYTCRPTHMGWLAMVEIDGVFTVATGATPEDANFALALTLEGGGQSWAAFYDGETRDGLGTD